MSIGISLSAGDNRIIGSNFRHEFLASRSIAAMMTCLVNIRMTEISGFHHFLFCHRLGISGKNKGIFTMSQEKSHGIIISVVITLATRSNYLRLCIAEFYAPSELCFGQRKTFFLAGIQKFFVISGCRNVLIIQVWNDNLTDLKLVNDLIHTAHMIGMGMSCHNIVKLFYALFIEKPYHPVGRFRFSAVDKHILSSGADKSGIALSHVDIAHCQFVLRKRRLTVVAESDCNECGCQCDKQNRYQDFQQLFPLLLRLFAVDFPDFFEEFFFP